MVSSTDGSSTYTGAKRRSRAASFSICLRYSLRVVAPMHCNSPLASAGFNMLEASIAPSAAPAPTTVWSSSMKRIISPWALRISSITAFSRSSNSPLNLEPATSAPRSRARMRLSLRVAGTSLSTIFWARPSATAVFPTPGSPMSAGLFFVRLERTWMTRWISVSLPITGSSFPSFAIAVRSRLNRSRA